MLSIIIFLIGLYVYTTSIMSSIRNASQQSELVKLSVSIQENKKTIDLLLIKVLKLEQWKEEINQQQFTPVTKGKRSKTPVSSPPSGSMSVKKTTLPTIKKELGNSELIFIIENGIKSEISWEELINHFDYSDKVSKKAKAPPRKELLEILIQQNEGLHWGISYKKKDIIYEFIQQESTPTKKQIEKDVEEQKPLLSVSNVIERNEQHQFPVVRSFTQVSDDETDNKQITQSNVIKKVEENKFVEKEHYQSSDDEDEEFEETDEEPVISEKINRDKEMTKSEPIIHTKVEEKKEVIKSQPIIHTKVEEKNETKPVNVPSNVNNIKIKSIDSKDLYSKSMLMKVYDIKLNGVSQIETLKTKLKSQVLALRESIKVLFPDVFVKTITSDYYNDVIAHCDENSISLTIQLIKTSDLTKPTNVEKEIIEYCSTNCVSPPVTKPIPNVNKLHQSMVLNTDKKPSTNQLSKSCVVHHQQDSDEDDEEFEDMDSDDEQFEEDDD